MRIHNFNADGVHGFLRFNMKFRNDLTFLTGINGSGKTSALNSMIALISPDLAMLADLDYSQISVEIEHDGVSHVVSATSTDDLITLHSSAAEESFTFSKFSPDPDEPSYRKLDSEAEYYRDLLSIKASHPTLKAITSLPTPMFLGIDRRSTLGLGRVPSGRQSRFGRNIFSKSLAGSLAAAATLAENRYRDALIQSGRLSERLQREMLLGLLGSSPAEGEHQNTLRLPTREDLREIQRVRRDLRSIADIMRIPVDEVQRRLLPLLDRLESLADRIPPDTDLNKVFSSGDVRSPVISAVAAWSANQSHLQRVKFISENVANYNEMREKILSHVTNYQELINTFLNDSGKSIIFDDEGYIRVKIHGVGDPKPISSLSSGEAQIFVILTHLSFNPSAQRNNVFIIDEPELSLHVQWQEMFVDSVLSANPSVQYILATHSPSIILDRTYSCIDLTKGGKRMRGRP